MASWFWGKWGAPAVVVLVLAAAVGFLYWHAHTPYPSHQGAAPPPCAAGGDSKPSVVLVLRALSPHPKVFVHVGDVVEVSFPDWQGQKLRSPTQRPALTCAVGSAAGASGSTLLVRALSPGTVTFYSGLVPPSGNTDSQAGAAGSPLIGGIIVIQ